MRFAVAAAAPKAPGGLADRPAAIEGRLGETLSNGALRFTLLEVRDARPGDHPEYVVPLASEKVMVVTARVHNVAPKAFAGLLTYARGRRRRVVLDPRPFLDAGDARSAARREGQTERALPRR